jgi:hypothetical protein
MPVKALAVQIEAFCVYELSWSGCASGLPAGWADRGPCPGRPHRVGEGGDVVGAVVAFAVDEERGGAGDAAEVCGVHVRGDLGLPGVIPEVG